MELAASSGSIGRKTKSDCHQFLVESRIPLSAASLLITWQREITTDMCARISAIARFTSMVITMGRGYGVPSKRGAGRLPTARGIDAKKSEVKGAHAHRYRHTLATRLLEQGATFEEVADILGNSPEVVRAHYGKWSKGRQANIDRLMFAHFESASVTNRVTKKSHEKMGAVN